MLAIRRDQTIGAAVRKRSNAEVIDQRLIRSFPCLRCLEQGLQLIRHPSDEARLEARESSV